MEEVTAFKALSPASFPNLIDQRFYQRRINRSKIPGWGFLIGPIVLAAFLIIKSVFSFLVMFLCPETY